MLLLSLRFETRHSELWTIHLRAFNTGVIATTQWVTLTDMTKAYLCFSLFIYNGLWPSVILLSHHMTSPFTAQGAGRPVAGLNACNDQAFCGSCSLLSPDEQLSPVRGR